MLSKLPVPGADAYVVAALDLSGPGSRWALDAGYNYFRAIIRKGNTLKELQRALTTMTTAASADGLACGTAGGSLAPFCLAIGAQRQGSAVKADTGGLALSSHGCCG